MRKFGKNLIRVTRTALFCAGFVAGFLIMWRLSTAYPQKFSAKYSYVFCGATGAVLGLTLMLSARSVLWLGYSVAIGVKKLFSGARTTDVAAVVIGAAVACALACLFDFLLAFGLKDIGLRVGIDIVFAILAFWGFALAASRVLRAFSEGSPHECDKKNCRVCDAEMGYLLDDSALDCDNVTEFCALWLVQRPVVLDTTVTALIGRGEAGARALQTYRMLVSESLVTTVSAAEATVLTYATAHRLRIVAARDDAFGTCPPVPVLGLATFTARAGADAKENSPSVVCNAVKAIDEM